MENFLEVAVSSADGCSEEVVVWKRESRSGRVPLTVRRSRTSGRLSFGCACESAVHCSVTPRPPAGAVAPRRVLLNEASARASTYPSASQEQNSNGAIWAVCARPSVRTHSTILTTPPSQRRIVLRETKWPNWHKAKWRSPTRSK